MNVWLCSAGLLMLAWIPCAVVCMKSKLEDRLAGLEIAGVIETILLVLLAEAFHRPAFFDLALTAALLSFGGGMVFARFLERWI